MNEIQAKNFLDSKIKNYLEKKNCRCSITPTTAIASAKVIFDDDVDLEKTKEEIINVLNSSYGQISGWNDLSWNNHPRYFKEKQKEEQNMSLKIKKIDVLTIEEFKENTKAYDEIKINIDNEKLKKFEEDYGVYDFTIYLCRYVKICDEVIEFLPKALCIGSVHCVPYEFIENIECTYYLETGK